MADTPDFSQMSDSDLQSIVSGGQQSQDQQQTPSLQNMSNDQLMSIVGSAPKDNPYAQMSDQDLMKIASGGQQQQTGPQSAEEEHQARVARYQPIADAAVAKEGAMKAFTTPTESSVPIVGPLVAKTIASSKAKSDDYASYGDTEDERYKNILAEQEAYNNARWQQHPWAYGAGHVATNIASAIPAAVLAPEAGATLAGAAGLGALTGAASSAASSAPGSTWSDIGKNALTGAEMGTIAGPAGNLVARGLGSLAGAARNTFENLFDTQSAAARSLLSGQAPTAAGEAAPSIIQKGLAEDKSAMPIDISGAKGIVEKAAGKASDTTAVDNLVSDLNNRYSDSTGVFQSAIDQAAGKPINSAAQQQLADKAKSDVLDKVYSAAYNDPNAQNLTPPNLGFLINNKFGTKAFSEADMMWNAKYGKPFTGGQQTAPPSFPALKPTTVNGQPNIQNSPQTGFSLEYLDYVKRSLNEQAKQAYKKGKNQLSTLITDQKNQLSDYMRNAVTDQNGNFLYGDATDTARRYFQNDNAYEAGQKFFDVGNIASKTSTPELPDQMMNAFSTEYTPAEKQSMANGLLSFIKENPQQAIRVFNAADNTTLGRYKTVLNTGIGPGTFDSVKNATDTAHLAAVANTITPKLPSNTINQVGLGAMGLALIENPALLTNPKALAVAGLGYGAKKGVEAVAARKANAIVRLATSQKPEDFQLLQRMLQSDAQSREIMQKLKTGMTAAVAATAGTATSHASGGRVGRAMGGKVMDAQTLVRDAERAKNRINKGTEPLLTVPDEAITKALAIANEKI